MEHNTDRILWTVLILAIGVALYVSFHPAANGLLHQGVEKIQTVATNVHGDTSDSSSSNSGTNTAVGTNLAHQTNSNWQKASFQNDWGITYLSGPIYGIVDGETYTAQVEVQNATSPVMLELFAVDANGNRDFTFDANGHWDGVLAPRQTADKDGKINITFTAHLPKGYAYLRPNLAFTKPLTSPGSYEYRRFKIEKGSEATPWVP